MAPGLIRTRSVILDDGLQSWVASLAGLDSDSRHWHLRALSRTNINPHYDITIDVLSELGCPHLKGGRLTLWQPGGLSAAQKKLRGAWMPKLLALATEHRLHLPAEISAFLGGVSIDGSWRELIASEEGSYVLANALLAYVDARAPKFTSARQKATMVQLRKEIDPMVLNILQDWYGQDTLLTRLPSTRDVLASCFGPSFSALYAVVNEDVCAAVAQQRPPFLPGLCPAQEIQQSAPLPDHLGPS
jgi:hypothetical protein